MAYRLITDLFELDTYGGIQYEEGHQRPCYFTVVSENVSLAKWRLRCRLAVAISKTDQIPVGTSAGKIVSFQCGSDTHQGLVQ